MFEFKNGYTYFVFENNYAFDLFVLVLILHT